MKGRSSGTSIRHFLPLPRIHAGVSFGLAIAGDTPRPILVNEWVVVYMKRSISTLRTRNNIGLDVVER